MSFDLVCLGEPLYELNQQADGRFLPGFGGDTMNVAIAAARLGARTAMIARLGADPFGDAIEALLRHERVDTSGISRDQSAATGLYLVTHGVTGHHFTYYRNGSAASRLGADNVPQSLFADARFFHFSGISQAISARARAAVDAAIAEAQRSGARISYDTNLRLRLWSAEEARPVIEAAARQAYCLKTSLEDAALLHGLEDPAAIAARFLGLGCAIVLVTLGKEGVYLADGARRERIAGCHVDAVDATGAGDAFTGAFLAELIAGKSAVDAARFANAAAALSTLNYGAVGPLPRRDAVERSLREMT